MKCGSPKPQRLDLSKNKQMNNKVNLQVKDLRDDGFLFV